MNESMLKQAFYEAALELVPTSVRQVLAGNEELSSAVGLRHEAVLTIGGDGPSFSVDALELATRAASTASDGVQVVDREGRNWELRRIATDNGTAHSLARMDRVYRLASLPETLDGSALLKEARAAVRAGGLDKRDERELALESDVPALGTRATAIASALKLTPDAVHALAIHRFTEGAINLKDQFPTHPRYYERLVGVASRHETLVSLTQDLLSGPPASSEELDVDGLRWILMRAGHASTIAATVKQVGQIELLASWEWTLTYGDLFSIVGLIETTMRLYPGDETLSAQVYRGIEVLLADDPEDDGSRYQLASHLIVWSESQILRTGTLSSRRPYWRRWAAMTHAALLEQALRQSGAPLQPLLDAIKGRGSHTFFLNGLLDLRLEPRWMPEFIQPAQLKSEAVSRIVMAGQAFLPEDGQLYARVASASAGSVAAMMIFPNAYLPGPLEGNVAPQDEIPSEALVRLASYESGGEFDPTVFAGLVNTCTAFRVTAEHSQLAQKVLVSVRTSVASHFAERDRLALVLGLARVAAAARDPGLAGEVRILSRIVRRLGTPDFALEELRVALTAAAAYEDESSWIASVDGWFVELVAELPSTDLTEFQSSMSLLTRLGSSVTGAFSRAQAILTSRLRLSPASAVIPPTEVNPG
jgi:hypothetical protein